MNKRQQTRQVLANLLDNTKGNPTFQRRQLEKAIMEARGGDKRTLKNWWEYLWTLEYFSQPAPESFRLNVSKVVELELEIRETNQTQLLQTSTHTHIILKSQSDLRVEEPKP